MKLAATVICTLVYGVAALAQERSSPPHIVVGLEGEAYVERSEWTSRSRLGFGTPLGDRDRIVLTPGARVRIGCSNLTIVPVPTRRASPVPCAEKAGVSVWRNEQIGETRGSGTDAFILIVAPRRTAVLDRRPLIRWLPVPGASSYRVRLGGWSSSPTERTEMRYPDTAPVLSGGKPYRFVVEVAAPPALTGISSSGDVTPGAGFTVVDDDKAAVIRKKLDSIARLDVPDDAKTLLKASMYAAERLRSEAADLFESLAAKSSSPYPALMLAEYYGESGVPGLVEKWCRTALALAQAGKLDEAEARALEGLAHVTASERGKAAALEYFSRAIVKYTALGSKADLARLRTYAP